MNQNYYVAIMAGGVGSRFWPASTNDQPKQFLDILGVGRSLLQLTYDRFLNLVPKERILIVTNEAYVGLVATHLPELPAENILAEPSRNNTAPCIALTALKLQKLDPEAVFVVAPSDHFILKEDLFIDKIRQSLEFVNEQDAIVTLGILPTRPDTNYGYIEVPSMDHEGFIKVKSFREKPDVETAEEYVNSGQYFWNAGIFIWKAKDLLNAFGTHAPGIVRILSEDLSKLNSSDEKEYLLNTYPRTEKISVDYAILEKAKNVYTLPADIGWSDLGTWNSLHAFLQKEDLSTVSTGDNIVLIDTNNSIIRSNNNKTVLIKGLSDFIVVDEKNALLIFPKVDEPDIKAILKQNGIPT